MRVRLALPHSVTEGVFEELTFIGLHRLQYSPITAAITSRQVHCQPCDRPAFAVAAPVWSSIEVSCPSGRNANPPSAAVFARTVPGEPIRVARCHGLLVAVLGWLAMGG